jgi:mRNA-degrading endonuclease RelE of RelBE toxin-antitoxin system
MALSIERSEEARADIRRFDKPTARHIFDAVLRLARIGQGDIKQLQGEYAGKLRLRAGDYRLFISEAGGTLRLHSIRHRKGAYC